MLTFLSSQLRARPARVAVLGAGILIAAVAFVLLAAATQTSRIEVRGTITANYRSAYDVLVRPKGSATRLERSRGLVRDNFLSGIFGGISLAQYHEIERIPGVEVTAPIANVGYLLPFTYVPIPLNRLLTDTPRQLYRVDGRFVANGVSRYPAEASYVYYTPRYRFENHNEIVEIEPDRSEAPICGGFEAHYAQVESRPFVPYSTLSCFSARSPRISAYYYGRSYAQPGWVGSELAGSFPVFLAAIDPNAEARLLGLDKTIVKGRYLHEGEATERRLNPSHSLTWTEVPMLASSTNYLREQLHVTVRRLAVPADANVPRALAAGACEKAVVPCPSRVEPPPGASYRNAYQFVSGLSGPVVGHQTTSFASIYGRLLKGTFLPFTSYWSTSPVSYRQLARDRLAPLPVHNPVSIWRNPFYQGGFYKPPPDNQDVQFRRLNAHPPGNAVVVGQIVGRFDPRKLPGFSPLSRVPLETYRPPLLIPANTATRRALGGHDYGPTQNIGGYVSQPPLLLTTLQGLKTFLDPKLYSGVSKRQRQAPISSIRVRVKGVTGPDPLSRERVRTVATAIHDKTGLDVDVTAGSSPHPLQIALPAGKFGRPPLLLREGWSKKGISVSFLRALDRKDLALFALILLVSGLFLANGASATVRTRRAELGTLLTLGWSRAEIFRTVLGELALVSLLSGLAGSGLAAILVASLSLDFPLLDVLYVLPLAVALTLLAGVVPAWLATRADPLDAIRPPVRGGDRRGRHVNGLLGMALTNLRRLPSRTLVGGAGLVVGSAALTILVGIQRAFQGTLVGTLLGNAISLQVRGADYIALGLAIGLAAFSVADVLYLNLRERAAELVTLQTTGWSGRELFILVELEALLLGLMGGVAGAAVGLLVGGLLLAVPLLPLGIGAAIAAAGGTFAAAAASVYPASRMRRLAAPTVLAAE